MSDRRLLHRSPLGVTEYYVPTNDDSFVIQTVQDVEPLLDKNKADFNMVTKSDRWGDGKLVARVPLVIWDQWTRMGWTKDQSKLKALLNDADNQFLRIWPGRL